MNEIQKIIASIDFYEDAFNFSSVEEEAWFGRKCKDFECSIYPAIYKSDKKKLIKTLEKAIKELKENKIDFID
jgi:hypothetical protein